MAKPQGTLTGTQLEIMEAVWAGGRRGVTVAEIRDHVSRNRHVARTTVLTLVRRLQQRAWLVRKEDGRSHRYFASRSRERAMGRLAARFVDEFFGGSPAELVMSLLGTNRIGPKELKRLRDALAEAQEENAR